MQKMSVAEYLASPRHAHFFATDVAVQQKIRGRVEELNRSLKVAGKTPIINIQDDPKIVELHDGNATVVAWLIFARQRRLSTRFEEMARCFEHVVVLHNRMHHSGEIWHPFVPREVASASRLQRVKDPEHDGSETCKAVTHSGDAVYFDNRDFFSGVDECKTLGWIADQIGPHL